jgi:hypothetical protein
MMLWCEAIGVIAVGLAWLGRVFRCALAHVNHGPLGGRGRANGALATNRRTSVSSPSRVRYVQSGRAWKEGVRILGADHLRQWPFLCASQLHKELDGNRIFPHLQWTAGCAAGTLDPIHVQFLLWWRWVS